MKKLSSIIVKMFAMTLVLSMLMLTGCSGSSSSSVAYIKDNEVYLDGNKISEQFLDDIYAKDDSIAAEILYNVVKLSADGKRIFYPEKYIEHGAFSLFCRAGNGSPKAVAEKVTTYYVSDKGDRVAYRTRDEALYVHDLNNSEKIADKVVYYVFAKDGSRLLYVTKDYKLYIKDWGKKANLIDSYMFHNSYSLAIRCDENLNTVFFLKSKPKTDDVSKTEYGFSLFACKDGKTAKQIGKNVSSVMDLHTFDTSEVYYVATDGKEYYKYADCLVNDMGQEGEEKLNSYRNDDVTILHKSLWYYDGKQSKKIASHIDTAGTFYQNGKKYVAYRQYEKQPVKELPLSKADKENDVIEHVKSYFNSFVKLSIISGGKTIVTSKTNKILVGITDEAIYFTGEKYGYPDSNLYKSNIKNGVADDKLIIIKDVSARYNTFKNSIVYKSKAGDLYVDDKKIASNVHTFTVYTDDEGVEYLCCFTDYNKEDYSSTLKLYVDGEFETIAEKVRYDRVRNIDNDLVLLNNYNKETSTFDLCIYSKGKLKKIDSGVSSYIIR
ncbi:MAG: hypothetical protein IJF58_02705 [Clostridia bacterium]|nr:hypothetical protein [Clostridia bacterium]